MEIPYKNHPQIPHKTLEIFAMHAIGLKDLHQLILHSKFSEKEQSVFEECIVKFKNGAPVEYITGVCNFYGLNFVVTNAVLIPRTDTEILVENAINFIGSKNLKVLELCTGSGCVAISVAKNCENARFLAADICPNALEICKQNIAQHNLESRIETTICNILKKMPAGVFNVLISNPPYIETSTIETLQPSVKNFEPTIALDGGHDGLNFYRKIFEYLQKNPMPAFLEIGFNQGSAVQILAKNVGIFNGKIIKDFAENDRVFACNL